MWVSDVDAVVARVSAAEYGRRALRTCVSSGSMRNRTESGACVLHRPGEDREHPRIATLGNVEAHEFRRRL